MPIRRKYGPVQRRSRHFREQRGLLLAQRISPHRAVVALLLGERKILAVRRPGIGNVRHFLVRLRETLRNSTAVGALPPDPKVAFAIGLERYALAVGGPDGIAVRARSGKRQAPRRRASGQLVNPDARFPGVVDLIRNALAIPGYARKPVGRGRDLQ